MSPDKQRVAIAEACGYEWCRIGTDEKPYRMLCIMAPVYTAADMTEPVCNPAYMWEHGHIPDYLSDLNAMHEAEKAVGLIVGPAEWDRYCMELRVKIGRDIEIQGGPGSVAGLMCLETAVSATAAQRAEAFLKTLGKWTP